MTDKNRLDPEIASIIENYRPDQYDDVIAEKEEQEFLWRTEHGLDIKFLFAS